MKTLGVRLSTAVLLLASILVSDPGNAQSSPSIDEALRDVEAKGLTGISCDTFLTLASQQDKRLSQLVAAWLDGFVRGRNLALDATTQDPGRAVLELALIDFSTSFGAAVLNASRGSPTATRQSQLSDYCEGHRAKTVYDAAQHVLFEQWRRIPRKQ